jgi:hypothetical protein
MKKFLPFLFLLFWVNTALAGISMVDACHEGIQCEGKVRILAEGTLQRCDGTTWIDILEVEMPLSPSSFSFGSIAGGYYHSLGLKSDGTVVGVGFNDDGRIDVTGWTDIVQVAAGYSHSLGLKSDGTVVGVGRDNYNQVSDVTGWTDIVQFAAGRYHSLGLKSDGTVVGVGWDNYNQVSDVTGWTDILLPQ